MENIITNSSLPISTDDCFVLSCIIFPFLPSQLSPPACKHCEYVSSPTILHILRSKKKAFILETKAFFCWWLHTVVRANTFKLGINFTEDHVPTPFLNSTFIAVQFPCNLFSRDECYILLVFNNFLRPSRSSMFETQWLTVAYDVCHFKIQFEIVKKYCIISPFLQLIQSRSM